MLEVKQIKALRRELAKGDYSLFLSFETVAPLCWETYDDNGPAELKAEEVALVTVQKDGACAQAMFRYQGLSWPLLIERTERCIERLWEQARDQLASREWKAI